MSRHRHAPPAAPHAVDAGERSNRSLPYLAIAGYISYFTSGFISTLFRDGSFGQILSWQIGTASAITADVVMGVWLARKGLDLAAAGFTMLGIVETVFFSGLLVTTVEHRIAATGNLLLVPAFVLITFCRLFPIWVRLFGWVVVALFIVMYTRVARGAHQPEAALQVASYFLQELLGVVWAYYIWKEARRDR